GVAAVRDRRPDGRVACRDPLLVPERREHARQREEALVGLQKSPAPTYELRSAPGGQAKIALPVWLMYSLLVHEVEPDPGGEAETGGEGRRRPTSSACPAAARGAGTRR